MQWRFAWSEVWSPSSATSKPLEVLSDGSVFVTHGEPLRPHLIGYANKVNHAKSLRPQGVSVASKEGWTENQVGNTSRWCAGTRGCQEGNKSWRQWKLCVRNPPGLYPMHFLAGSNLYLHSVINDIYEYNSFQWVLCFWWDEVEGGLAVGIRSESDLVWTLPSDFKVGP